MSLIQEALKRKLEEKGGSAPAATPPPPPAALANASISPSAQAQSSVTVNQAEPARGNGAKVIGMVVAIAVMILAAAVLIEMALKSWSSKKAVASQPVPMSIPAGTVSVSGKLPLSPVATDAEHQDTASQSANPYASVTARVADMKKKVLDARRSGAEITGDTPPPPEAAKPKSTPAVVAASAPAKLAPAKLASGKPAPVAVASAGGGAAAQGQEFSLWPRITVNGILAKGSSGKGIAIINNQMVSVNESVEGVRLVDVRGQGVTMEFGGESRFVEIGQTVQ